MSERAKPGLFFRLVRWALVALAAWLAVAWVVSVTGLYFWFPLTTHDKVRVEYGRVKWTHSSGRPVRGSSGVDGGASKAKWDFELRETGSGFIARIPLWAPFAVVVLLIALMTYLGRRRGEWQRRLPTDADEAFA